MKSKKTSGITKYFKVVDKTVHLPNTSSTNLSSEPNIQVEVPTVTVTEGVTSQEIHEEQPETPHENLDLSELPSDPGKRPRITAYDPNIRERVRRNYYMNGPCQPKLKEFPQRMIGGRMRRFVPLWYTEFGWLEYSISTDSCFCLYCYLFKNELGHQGGGDTFVTEGFRDWKNKDKFRKHEGGVNSAHRKSFGRCVDLLNQKQHIETIVVKMTDEAKLEYKTRLNASIDCVRWLLTQGLAFRGRDESDESRNQGNFLELLKFLSDHDENVRKVVLKNAPKNLQLTSPRIQKDIVNACALETSKAIIDELGDGFFSVLLDDSRDVSTKEQMAVVLRFVDKRGRVLERTLGFKHVESTTSLTLKGALNELLNAHGLSISMMRGQGYDGASNMQGEFNGLKSLILKENSAAYYVHCFAHQLQLALVGVAKNHERISELFVLLSNVVNVVGASCKRKDNLREIQAQRIVEAMESEEITSGRGLNQESTLIRPSDTRWGSHYNTILSLINLFPSVIDVLGIVKKEGTQSSQRGEASRLIKDIQSFDFAFDLHLMKTILGITNDLSQALQRKDQDIVNAMNLVDVSKRRLQAMRDDGWDELVDEVSVFCRKYKIKVPKMNDEYVGGKRKRSRRKVEEMTNSHRYRVEVFNTVIDMQLSELNSRFGEVSTELLLCVACLNPSNSFESFDRQKLVRLAEFYPNDFQDVERLALSDQLENFVLDMRSNIDTLKVNGLGDLAQMLVESKRDKVYPLVYRLITLALILPVATATVERAFSAMNIVKNRLRNRMSDEWMNDNLIIYLEKDIFKQVSNEAIMHRFQNMANRRGQL